MSNQILCTIHNFSYSLTKMQVSAMKFFYNYLGYSQTFHSYFQQDAEFPSEVTGFLPRGTAANCRKSLPRGRISDFPTEIQTPRGACEIFRQEITQQRNSTKIAATQPGTICIATTHSGVTAISQIF